MVIGSYYLTNPGLEIGDLERVANDTKVAKGRRETADNQLNEIYADAPRFSSYGEVEMALAQSA